MSHTLKIEVSSEHNAAATPVGGLYPVSLIRKLLEASELYPVNQRYDAGTDTVQYTNDGGATWIDAPELDPRHQANIAPRPGTDVPCQSAASATEYLKRYINMIVPLLQASATAVQGATATLGFLQLLAGEFAILWDLIAGLFGVLVGFGASAVEAAFDDAVYHEIACILKCHMDGYGQLNQASLDAAEAQISLDIGGTAATVANLVFTLMGFAGVNRAGSFYDMDADCSDCASCNWCYLWSASNVPSWQFYPDAQWSGGFRGQFASSLWQSVNRIAGGPLSREVMMRIIPNFPVTITSISITFTKTAGTFNSAAQDVIVVDSGNGYYNGTILLSVNSNGHAAGTWVWSGSHLVSSEITIWMFASAYTGSGSFGSLNITDIKIQGEGANPFADSNCT